MNRNIEPGCLAIVIGESAFAGRIVECLYRAPAHDFRLPDGYTHVGCEQPDGWVLKFLTPVQAPIFSGNRQTGTRKTQYGVGSERRLRRFPDEAEFEYSEKKERAVA